MAIKQHISDIDLSKNYYIEPSYSYEFYQHQILVKDKNSCTTCGIIQYDNNSWKILGNKYFEAFKLIDAVRKVIQIQQEFYNTVKEFSEKYNIKLQPL